jgi:hypothetical protein
MGVVCLRLLCCAFHDLRRLRWSVLVYRNRLGRPTISRRSAVLVSNVARGSAPNGPESFTESRLHLDEFLDDTAQDGITAHYT